MAIPGIPKLSVKVDTLKNPPYLTHKIGVNSQKITQPYYMYQVKHEATMLRGGYKPSELTNSLNQRASYMFDYNNQNEVNSYADVVMRTYAKMGEAAKGIVPWIDVAKQTGSDIHSVVYKGTIKPIEAMVRGDLEWEDAGVVFFNNQLVNFSESVDLIDNIYKGYVLSGGLQDHDKGVAGVKKAIYDRKNFDFDTGNKMNDLILELLTPSNIALAIGSLGVGALAREGLEAGAETVGKKVIKSFSKNYMGDIEKTFIKMPIQLTSAQQVAMREIATHNMNLTLLHSLNAARGAVNFVDMLGPKIAIKSTVGIPWKVMKGAYGMTEVFTKYTANTVAEIVKPTDSLMSVIAKSPELDFALNNLAAAGELNGDAMAPFIKAETLKAYAISDRRAIERAFNKVTKIDISDKEVRNIMQATYNDSGITMDYISVKQDLIHMKQTELFKKIDETVFELSGGTYKQFDEYNNFVTRLSEIGGMSEEVKALKEVLDKITKQKRVYHIYENQSAAIKVINDTRYKVNEVLENISAAEHYKKFKKFYEQDYYTNFKYDISKVINIEELLGENFKVNSLHDLKDIIDMEINSIDVQIARLKSIANYKSNTKIVDEINLLRQRGNKLFPTLEDVDNKIISFDNAANKLIEHIRTGQLDGILYDYEKQIAKLDNVLAEAGPLEKEIILNYKAPFEDVAGKLQDLFEKVKTEGATLGETITRVNNIVKTLDNLAVDVQAIPDNFFKNVDLTAKMNALTKSLYGGDSVKFMEDMIQELEVKAGHTKVDGVYNKIMDTMFSENKVHNELKVKEFNEAIRKLLDEKNFETILEETGIDLTAKPIIDSITDKTTLGVLEIDFRDSLEIVRAFVNKEGKQTANEFADVLDELSAIKRTLNMAAKQIKEEFTTVIKGKLETTVTVTPNLSKQLASDIDDMLKLFEFSTNETLEFSKEFAKSYRPQVNRTYRNLHLLSGEKINDLLDAVDLKFYQDIPALESLESMSRWDISEINRLDIALKESNRNSNMKGLYDSDPNKAQAAYDSIHSIYKDIMGKPLAENDAFSVLKTIDSIKEIQHSAMVIMDTLEGMVSVRKLYGSVQTAIEEGLDRNIANRFVDAIQTMYNQPALLTTAHEMAKEPWMLDYRINNILNNVQNNLRTDSLKYSVSLENWSERIEEMVRFGELPQDALDEFQILFPKGAAHVAVGDSVSEHLVHKYLLKDEFVKGQKNLYLDIETTDLSKELGQTLQMSMVIPEDNVYRLYINTDASASQVPGDHVLHLLFGDKRHEKYTTSKLREHYTKIYQEGDIDLLKEYFPMSKEIEIIPVKGEEELLRTYVDAITQGEKGLADIKGAAPRKYTYRMHNGIDFDSKFINHKANKYGIDFRMPVERIDDSKIRLEEKLGIKTLTENERATLTGIIENYIKTREIELSSNRLMTKARKELSKIDLEKGIGAESAGVIEIGKFLPTMDTEFKTAYNQLENIFNPATKTAKKSGDFFSEADEFFRDLTNVFQEVNEHLSDVRKFDSELKRMTLTVEPEMFDVKTAARILPDDVWKDAVGEDISELVRANHIGRDIAHMNTHDGVYLPIFGVKTSVNANLAVQYFPEGLSNLSYRGLERVTEIASSIERIAGKIRNLDYVVDVPMDELYKLHAILSEELSRMAGPTLYDPMLKSLKLQDNMQHELAVLMHMYRKYKNVSKAGNKVVFSKFSIENSMDMYLTDFMKAITTVDNYKIIEVLENEKIVTHLSLDRIYDPELFHRIVLEGDYEKLGKIIMGHVSENIRTLEKIEEIHDTLEFSRLKALLPIYRDSLGSFKHTEELMNILTTIQERAFADNPKLRLTQGNWASGVYNQLRVMEEAYDAGISYDKMNWVLSRTPDEMLSFLRHQGKSVVLFKNTSLEAANYFPMRNNRSLKQVFEGNLINEYQKLYDNKALYESKGISFNFGKDYTAIYIKDIDMEKMVDVPYTRITKDFDTDELIKRILDAGLTGDDAARLIRDNAPEQAQEIMNALSKSRKNLMGIGVDANTSTLEVLDDIAMTDFLKKLDTLAPGHASMETLNKYGIIDGNYFNHSIIGHVDTRREFMPYSAFNPAKTMYHATNLIEKHLDAQIQYIKLMQAPELMLDNVVKHMSSDEIVTYLKKSPHLRVAFLNGNKAGTDFKLNAITVNNAKDIAFAVDKKAVIVDRMTYATAYSVINRYKISNPVLRFLDRALVAPFKIGWLAWNPGVVARNIFDTSLKNMATTKEWGMVESMAKMTQDYAHFRNVDEAIHRLGNELNLKLEPAVEAYFAKGDSPITRETFDLIREYVKAGGTTTKGQEALKYYGDAANRMFQRIGGVESGISEKEFKELLRMPDDLAKTWLERKISVPPEAHSSILRVKGDLLTYKRAYEMNKIYKGQDMPVETLINYIKSGRVPEEHIEPFKELVNKTRHITTDKDFLEQIMDHPLVANSLSWNMYTEEALRLSMYKFLKDEGLTPAKAMAEIEITHFNYDKKNRFQLLLEMVMPFSTFRVNSLIYWAEHLSDSPMLTEILGDAWKSASQFNEREHTDVLLRRSLRYQMYTGNVILNEESGFTAKLNPSTIDTMNFFASPLHYIWDSKHSGIDAVNKLVFAQQKDWQSDEAFASQKRSALFNLIPFLGTYVNRYNTMEYQLTKNDKESNPAASIVKAIMLAPMFNNTWTPAQSDYTPYKPSVKYYHSSTNWNNYNKYPRAKRYVRNRYPAFTYGYKDWSKYSSYSRMYDSVSYRWRRGSAYPSKNSRSLNTAFSSMWRRSMTKKGNVKYRFLSFPTNKWTRDIKITMLRNITSYYRWQ